MTFSEKHKLKELLGFFIRSESVYKFFGIWVSYGYKERGQGVALSMHCPNCQSKNIGKIGSQQYYCWNCFIELSDLGGILDVHQVESDGSLSSLNDLFTEDERKAQW
jgi:hypothetical protein